MWLIILKKQVDIPKNKVVLANKDYIISRKLSRFEHIMHSLAEIKKKQKPVNLLIRVLNKIDNFFLKSNWKTLQNYNINFTSIRTLTIELINKKKHWREFKGKETFIVEGNMTLRIFINIVIKFRILKKTCSSVKLKMNSVLSIAYIQGS